MRRIIGPLERMGGSIQAKDNTYAPLEIAGGTLQGIRYEMEYKSAQVKSCVLLAGLFAEGETTVVEPVASRDHTERMLKWLGASIRQEGSEITVDGSSPLQGRPITVPGDLSSAAFLVGAATIVPNSELLIENIGINPTRTGFFEVMEQMGAEIEFLNEREVNHEPIADIKVRTSQLKGVTIGGDVIPRLIDEIPLLACLATQAEGTTVIKDAAELRVKESDRIEATVDNLRRMGADIEGTPDGMIVRGPKPLQGCTVEGYHDHRIIMMSAIAGLVAQSPITIPEAHWAEISFPGFFQLLKDITQST